MRIHFIFLVLALASSLRCPAASPLIEFEGNPPRIAILGLDGLSVDGVVKTASPNIRRLMARGSWTFQARAVMPTLSSPNWATVITGAGPEQHGITSNGWFRKMVEFQPVCAGPKGIFPTIFSLLRTQRPDSRIAVFHDWNAFSKLLERDVPDVLKHCRGAAATMRTAIAYWRTAKPDLTFVHLDNIDHAGHSDGWRSKNYYKAVMEADRLVGQFLDMLDQTGKTSRTLVLLTSDHGGIGHGHGKNSLDEILVPWIIAGPGVAAGREVQFPVSATDSAPTIAWILGLDTPDCWVGRPVRVAFDLRNFNEHRAAGGSLRGRGSALESR